MRPTRPRRARSTGARCGPRSTTRSSWPISRWTATTCARLECPPGAGSVVFSTRCWHGSWRNHAATRVIRCSPRRAASPRCRMAIAREAPFDAASPRRPTLMFFRGRQPETSIWRRFRAGIDGFTFVKEADHYVAHVVANAERIVDLFHTLGEELPPAVDVAIEDYRSGRAWEGRSVALPDVRDAIARLK